MRLCILSFVVLLLGQFPLQAQDEDLRQAKALERTMEKTIEQNEASIACILVSRSELYADFGQGPDRDRPGKLGGFDSHALKQHQQWVGETSVEKKSAWLRTLDFTHPDYLPKAFGSGVVVDADGLILTNYHVVEEATKIFVKLPGGKSGYADIHAADPRCDLAVLKLLNPNALPLKPITFGDADKLKRGHFVLTMSNPFAAGFRDEHPSASYGILSNIQRRAFANLKEEDRVKPLHYYGTLLQTDAKVNLGCSGGAMFNLSGEMVGLTSSIAAIQGGETPGGFAIPINAPMRRFIEVLKRGEEIDYGFLGVGFDQQAAGGKNGVRISYAMPGSPAQLEGNLTRDDIILRINGHPIQEAEDIYVQLGTQMAGDKIKLDIRSGDKDHGVQVTLAKLHVPGKIIASSNGSRPYFRGLRVDYSSLAVQRLPKRDRIPGGVYISDIVPGSSAERAELRKGDVISQVNGIPVATPAQFYEAVRGAREPVQLTVFGEPSTKVSLK